MNARNLSKFDYIRVQILGKTTFIDSSYVCLSVYNQKSLNNKSSIKFSNKDKVEFEHNNNFVYAGKFTNVNSISTYVGETGELERGKIDHNKRDENSYVLTHYLPIITNVCGENDFNRIETQILLV